MLSMNKKRIIGVFLLAIGLFLLLNSQVNILGAVVGISEINLILSLVFGLVFIIIGVFLMFITHRRERIIRDPSFDKSIKKYKGEELIAIEDAIQKIGTGLGHEEKLRHLPGYAIRVTKGGRIRYERDPSGNIHLRFYEPAHQYAA